MRTMFASQDNKSRKRFQKPNILRKRTKVPPKPNITLTQESPIECVHVTSTLSEDIQTIEESTMRVRCDGSPDKTVQKLIFSDINDEIFEITESDGTESLLLGNSYLINNNEENLSPPSTDVESYLNSTVPIGNISLQEIQTDFSVKEQWCLDFMNNAQEIIIEDVDGSHLGSLCVTTAPTVTSVPISVATSRPSTEITTSMPVQNLSLEFLASSTMKFKCDIQDCKKRFRSEKALKKHKNSHESPKVVRQVTLECPVKKVSSTGVQESCSVLCSSKEELVQHLNENHSPQDAMYICKECGRRFFWASGLRAHARTHCAAGRAPLECAWPGCGRSYRQPCRLREHMRAHTGDKPYPCVHPNCSWAFRTASKLMRHAARHTGERRHACAACGRAFRRREHLRDHAARHHAAPPPPPPPHALRCTRTDCRKMKFPSPEALKVHMDVVHQEECSESKADVAPVAPAWPHDPPFDTFMISLSSPPPLNETEGEAIRLAISETEGEAEGVIETVEEGFCEPERFHAARTHCTWPLEPREVPVAPEALVALEAPEAPMAPAQAEPPPSARDWDFEDGEYVQVELSEGSGSNIYTIRSDLFLHGNILNNDDSEQMPGAENSSQLVVSTAGDADSDLSLLDAHPTIGLMQEELMYTDSAVDESSFRVFLLSEELS